MRLIDADALRDEIAVLFERNPNLIDGWLAYAVEDTIDDAPTIDPVKHGRWIKAKRHGCWSYADVYKQCSECGKVTFLAEKMNYCPNCGTRMEGEEDG